MAGAQREGSSGRLQMLMRGGHPRSWKVFFSHGSCGQPFFNSPGQFADGVILLLLIGQLQGYFLNLGDFFLNPSSVSEMVHNVNLAVELLVDGGLLDSPINPEDVVNQDLNATLLILYSLFSRYKMKEI